VLPTSFVRLVLKPIIGTPFYHSFDDNDDVDDIGTRYTTCIASNKFQLLILEDANWPMSSPNNGEVVEQLVPNTDCWVLVTTSHQSGLQYLYKSANLQSRSETADVPLEPVPRAALMSLWSGDPISSAADKCFEISHGVPLAFQILSRSAWDGVVGVVRLSLPILATAPWMLTRVDFSSLSMQ